MVGLRDEVVYRIEIDAMRLVGMQHFEERSGRRRWVFELDVVAAAKLAVAHLLAELGVLVRIVFVANTLPLVAGADTQVQAGPIDGLTRLSRLGSANDGRGFGRQIGRFLLRSRGWGGLFGCHVAIPCLA